MSPLADVGRRVLRALTGQEPEAGASGSTSNRGSRLALDGASAVAAVETAVVGDAFLEGGDPRGDLSEAMGLCLGGHRASAWLRGDALPGMGDLLHAAAGRHLPLVAHVVNRAVGGPGRADGTGYGAVHAVADTGWALLCARNVQDAVDLTLVARALSEAALVPSLVTMDDQETARAVEDLELPSPELIRSFLGLPEDLLESPTQAQLLAFGPRRRRVPREFDPDRPSLLGATLEPGAHAAAVAGERPFFLDHVPWFLDDAFARYAKVSGRTLSPVMASGVEDAEILVLAMGSDAELASAVARALRRQERMRVGVLGLLSLRPFPGRRLLEYVAGRKAVVVLERTDNPLAGESPLLRELRAALGRASENARFGAAAHPGWPAISEKALPRLHSALHGLGGAPTRAADLAAAIREASTRGRALVYLGFGVERSDPQAPKRQAFLDLLHRTHPGLADLGLLSAQPISVLPEGAVVVAVSQPARDPGLMRPLASLLQAALGGRVRALLGGAEAGWTASRTDLVRAGPDTLENPGEDTPVDLVVLRAEEPSHLPSRLPTTRAGASVLLESPLDDETLIRNLPPTLRCALAASSLHIFVSAPTGELDDSLLGAIAALLTTRHLPTLKLRKLASAHAFLLGRRDRSEVERRMAAFEAGALAPRPLALPSEAGSDPLTTPAVPEALRRQDVGSASPMLSLPRFWDQIGSRVLDGQERLGPDPCLSLGALPASTSSFLDLSAERTNLPLLDPSRCTGCGACWRVCPEGAILATAPTVAELLESGLTTASRAEPQVEALRPFLSQLARRSRRILQETTEQEPANRVRSLTALLDGCADAVFEKANLDEERKLEVRQAWSAVRDTLGDLPFAATEPFLLAPERADGTGAPLFLALRVDACKDCGACATVCLAGAIERVPQTPQGLAQARRHLARFEQLPETGERLRAWLAREGVPDALALLLMARRQPLGGGDSAEPGSGERLALRSLLTAAEHHQAPRQAELGALVDQLVGRIQGLLRESLAAALPVERLDGLAKALGQLQKPSFDLREVLRDVEPSFEHRGLSTARFRRLVDLGRRLGALRESLLLSSDGVFLRPSATLALAPGRLADWSARFPWNPFRLPVIVANGGEAAGLARGLAEAQTRLFLEEMRLIRQARMELERPDDIDHDPAAPSRLTWADLDASEKALCPPILLAGEESLLTGPDLGVLASLLASELPVKVLLVADLALGLMNAGGTYGLGSFERAPDELLLLGLARRGAFFLQGSLSRPEHLARGMLDAMAWPGPALLRIHTPSPGAHGFPSDRSLERAEAAVLARVFPLLRYDPRADGVFGTRVSLDGNPEPDAELAHDAEGVAWDLRRWAEGETRFDRALALAPALVTARAEERRLQWRMLQELSGRVTPFIERVRAEIEARIDAEKRAEIDALERGHAEETQALRENLEAEMIGRVRSGLLRLAGLRPPAEEA